MSWSWPTCCCVGGDCHAIQVLAEQNISGWPGMRPGMLDLDLTINSGSNPEQVSELILLAAAIFPGNTRAINESYAGVDGRGAESLLPFLGPPGVHTVLVYLKLKAGYSGYLWDVSVPETPVARAFAYTLEDEVDQRTSYFKSRVVTTGGPQYNWAMDVLTGAVTASGDPQAVMNHPVPGYGAVFGAFNLADVAANGGTVRVKTEADLVALPGGGSRRIAQRVTLTVSVPEGYFDNFTPSPAGDFISTLEWTSPFTLEQADAHADTLLRHVQLENLAHLYDEDIINAPPANPRRLEFDQHYTVRWRPQDFIPPWHQIYFNNDGDIIPDFPSRPRIVCDGPLDAFTQFIGANREYKQAAPGDGGVPPPPFNSYFWNTIGVAHEMCRFQVATGSDCCARHAFQFPPVESTDRFLNSLQDGRPGAYVWPPDGITEQFFCAQHFRGAGDHVLRPSDMLYSWGKTEIHRQHLFGYNADFVLGCWPNASWGTGNFTCCAS